MQSLRDPAFLLEQTLAGWDGHSDIWVFAYASLIWRPDCDFDQKRPASVHGWHRALKMWSRVNRGTPQQPGLVFALLPGGSCRGMALRIQRRHVPETLQTLWEREMPSCVYDPRWLPCRTSEGPVTALAFTLSRRSPSYTGELSPGQYQQIFAQARGRYGTTLDYARQTYDSLKAHGIHDHSLARLLVHATKARRG